MRHSHSVPWSQVGVIILSAVLMLAALLYWQAQQQLTYTHTMQGEPVFQLIHSGHYRVAEIASEREEVTIIDTRTGWDVLRLEVRVDTPATIEAYETQVRSETEAAAQLSGVPPVIISGHTSKNIGTRMVYFFHQENQGNNRATGVFFEKDTTIRFSYPTATLTQAERLIQNIQVT